jgi:hypothetical protein
VADKPSTKIALSDVDAIDQLLDQVPTHRDTCVSKQKAIGMLAPKLHAMRSKGYSWNAIANWLMDHGLQVTPVALQGYLRRVRPADAAAEPTPARKPGPRPRERRAGRSPAPAAPPAPAVAPTNAIRPPAPVATSAVERRTEAPVRRSEFAVRPDTKDI